MKNPFHIVLRMPGNYDWIGGFGYIENIVAAIKFLPFEEKEGIYISIKLPNSVPPFLRERIRTFVDKMYISEDFLPKETFLNKSRWMILRRMWGIEDPLRDEFFRSIKADFVYPFFTKGASSYRSAAWIPDFQHKYFREFFSEAELEHREKLFFSTFQNARRIVVSSKSVELDARKFYPQYSFKLRVVQYFIANHDEFVNGDPIGVQKKYNLPERFFLVSNQLWQHKNHFVLLDALSLLTEKAIRPIVVCTGYMHDNRNPDYAGSLFQKIHKSGLAEQVYFLGLIPRLDQMQLMRRSLAVIQPSLFEGWSTVVEDARVIGKPVILSDIRTHREQNPPGSEYFKVDSAEDLAENMNRWWNEKQPGPHLDQEQEAGKQVSEKAKDFARRFLYIARGG